MTGPERPPERPGEPRPVEEVLAVPRAELAADGLLVQGFSSGGWERCLERVRSSGRFVPRPRAEEDEGLKQIIPYAVVEFEGRVFLFRRTARGGEARLHGKWSIGVGGHINPGPAPPEGRVEAGLRRELEEELAFDRPYSFRPIGIINDDRLPVGRVHLGIVFRVEAGGPGVRVREKEMMEGRLAEVAELEPLLGSMESWSRLVAEDLYFPAGDGDRLP